MCHKHQHGHTEKKHYRTDYFEKLSSLTKSKLGELLLSVA